MTSTPPPEDTGARPVAALRAEVADAVAATGELAARPVAEHVAVFERLHTVLGDALSAGPERA